MHLLDPIWHESDIFRLEDKTKTASQMHVAPWIVWSTLWNGWRGNGWRLPHTATDWPKCSKAISGLVISRCLWIHSYSSLRGESLALGQSSVSRHLTCSLMIIMVVRMMMIIIMTMTMMMMIMLTPYDCIQPWWESWYWNLHVSGFMCIVQLFDQIWRV